MSTTTAMTKWIRTGALPSTRVAQLLRPLPASLEARLGEQAATHATLRERYGDTQARIVALERKLGETQQAGRSRSSQGADDRRC